ncbi:hypothetical protein L1987_55078 [Smallanthus sonchifolius]|uniref:Uncharacterized protein n=1 Tax=Smallanthus sonchifolius TaxID=185202 RepID=A0ACB9E8Y0_9ASTR|nr:hypothetical protein L1987_55078 [Smallanthus sonchifolius]
MSPVFGLQRSYGISGLQIPENLCPQWVIRYPVRYHSRIPDLDVAICNKLHHAQQYGLITQGKSVNRVRNGGLEDKTRSVIIPNLRVKMVEFQWEISLFRHPLRSKIIHELLSSTHFEQLLQDRHANYVVQTDLRVVEDSLHNLLVKAIESHKAISRNIPCLKQIFSYKLLKK